MKAFDSKELNNIDVAAWRNAYVEQQATSMPAPSSMPQQPSYSHISTPAQSMQDVPPAEQPFGGYPPPDARTLRVRDNPVSQLMSDGISK